MVDTKSCTGAQMRVLKVQTAEAALGHWVWQSQSLGSRSSILHLQTMTILHPCLSTVQDSLAAMGESGHFK